MPTLYETLSHMRQSFALTGVPAQDKNMLARIP
jgi:hypothetical protein